jgi:TDG/mug DNA glycosylase family protein
LLSKLRHRPPSKEEIRKAANKTINDLIAPNLKILFCGINPGLYSAAAGHNFARPGNRFWPAMFKAGFTDRLLSPNEETELLKHGYGITNIVRRATASADQLSKEELIRGAKKLKSKVRQYTPQYLAIVGLTAYRTAFISPKAIIGLQDEKIANTLIWVLPNPSGLNAHHQLPDLIKYFTELRSHSSESI